jgi:hypothetical protein
MMVQLAASNTILQTIAAEDKRGRVMGLCGLTGDHHPGPPMLFRGTVQPGEAG